MELEQFQQMLYLDGEQTSLKTLVANSHDNLKKISSEEDLRLGHLNLQKVRITPPHFCLSALT